MDLQAFRIEITDSVAYITLNQPDRGNPFDADFCRELNWLSAECADNPDICVTVMNASGPNFSFGGDLREFLQAPDTLPSRFRQMTSDLHMAVARFAKSDEPLIIETNGLVCGGAVGLVAASDFVFSAPDSRFYAAFGGIAMCGDTGITFHLPRRVGTRKATEFLLCNQMWSAEEALDYGLINAVLPAEDLRDHCKNIAASLTSTPPHVLGRMRRALLNSSAQSLEAQLEQEAMGMVDCAKSEHAVRAMKKILNKS